jgi:hypothetical protein
MFTQIYVEEKLREIKQREASVRERSRHADPNAEVPRTGVGLVHEVFRRIAEPEPAHGPRWRWVFAQ